ncbi:5-hydroxytryptamine receptor 1F-like [Exaiptasia diaphana]|uniref:G-protein coupled receptors family 1 profile domain-containing protein n=1 Tax=Exaiptasia diaphana TaxID=2652724 RepID=A0A913XMM5_EXADI|nr:5-hydroxytryptamine receptor 1F-like [Exaiptasia diaphana]
MNVSSKIPLLAHEYNFLLSMVVVNALVALLATFCNFLVILTLLKTPTIRTPSNVLVLGLAITDFITGCVLIPCYCVFLSTIMTNNKHSEIVRRAAFGLGSILLVASFYNVMVITGDRLLAVTLHLRYNNFVTNRRYTIALCCIWVLGFLTGSFRILYENQLFMKLIFFILFFISIDVNIVFLVKISRVVRKHTLQIHSQQRWATPSISTNIPRYKKSINTMYLLIGAFVLCYSPYLVQVAMAAVKKPSTDSVPVFKIIAQSILMANSLVNPIIYCIRIDEIRRNTLKIFSRLR